MVSTQSQRPLGKETTLVLHSLHITPRYFKTKITTQIILKPELQLDLCMDRSTWFCDWTQYTFPDPKHLFSLQQGLKVITLTEMPFFKECQTFWASQVLMNPDSQCVSQSIWHHQHHGTSMSLVGSDGPRSWRRLLGTSGSTSAAAAPAPVRRECSAALMICSVRAEPSQRE